MEVKLVFVPTWKVMFVLMANVPEYLDMARSLTQAAKFNTALDKILT